MVVEGYEVSAVIHRMRWHFVLADVLNKGGKLRILFISLRLCESKSVYVLP